MTYAWRTYTLGEQAAFLADPDRNPYRAHIAETAPGYHRIDCGHHPVLMARLVRRLEVAEQRREDGLVEVITWEECLSSWAWEPRTLTQRWSGTDAHEAEDPE